MRSIGALALAVAPLLLVARADVELDGDDVPRECQSICRPLVELSRRCDASDRFDNDDRAEDEYEKHEDHLRAQCFCSNDSFDVGMITAFCGDCIRQNERRDDDDDDDNDISDEIEDIAKIMATCGFTETASWSPSQSDVADSISVVATAPTAASQLTTTYTGTWTSQALPLETGNRGGAESDNENGGDNNGDDGDSMAAGGFSRTTILYSFGAFAAGVAFLL